MVDPSNAGYEPYYPHECGCGHADFQHHWTGKRYSYCTVQDWGRVCPCERYTP